MTIAEGGPGGGADVRHVSTRELRRLHDDVHRRLRHDTAASNYVAPHHQRRRGFVHYK